MGSSRGCRAGIRGGTTGAAPDAASTQFPVDDAPFHFVVRYRTTAVDDGARWLDYSRHPASKLGLHNALLALHDRIEILQERGDPYECGVFVSRRGRFEPLTQQGAEHLFAVLPAGDVKWIDLCRCLLPPIPETTMRSAASGSRGHEQLPLFPHVHTPYDDVETPSAAHALDISA